MKLDGELNKFYIEDPYSSNPKVYQYPVDGIDDDALVVVELGPVLKMMDKMAEAFDQVDNTSDCRFALQIIDKAREQYEAFRNELIK